MQYVAIHLHDMPFNAWAGATLPCIIPGSVGAVLLNTACLAWQDCMATQLIVAR